MATIKDEEEFFRRAEELDQEMTTWLEEAKARHAKQDAEFAETWARLEEEEKRAARKVGPPLTARMVVRGLHGMFIVMMSKIPVLGSLYLDALNRWDPRFRRPPRT